MIVTNSLTGGGAERSMNLLCNELHSRGWSISLVPINAGLPDQVVPACEVFPLDREWRGSLFNTVVAIKRFNLTIRKWNPDIIVLNCDLPELFGAILLSRRCLVAIEHVNRPWISRVILGKIIRKILKARGVIWVAVSSHLTIWPGTKLPNLVLQNSISIKEPLVVNESKNNQMVDIARLIFIGRLAPQKRPDWFLKIGNHTNIPMEVIGDGSMRKDLEAIAAGLSVVTNFRGQLRNPWENIEVGDVLIVPSAYEGDGLVVIEAMEKQVPLLLADIPEFRRFGLPEVNYCATVEDFVYKINSLSKSRATLIIPDWISAPIVNSRSSFEIGNSWEEFLTKI
jgi:glycosyltransferase involved in cell wall biosynthesis